MAQASTRATTFKAIISNHFFTRGVRDYCAGKPWDPEYEQWPYMQGKKYVAAQCSYERGRHFAAATAGKIRTKLGSAGKTVNPEAIWAMRELYENKAVI